MVEYKFPLESGKNAHIMKAVSRASPCNGSVASCCEHFPYVSANLRRKVARYHLISLQVLLQPRQIFKFLFPRE